MRVRLCRDSIEAAADAVIAELGDLGGSGGVIVAAPDGSAGWAFNTAGMYRGMIGHDAAAEIAIYGDE